MVSSAAPDPAIFTRLKVSHFGFGVADVREAVERWSGLYGAGPLFYFELGKTLVIEDLSFKGEPFELSRHPAVYGRCGAGKIELGEYELAEPDPELEAIFNPRPNGLNHVAIFAEDPEKTSAELEAQVFPRVISGRVRQNLWCWHDARDTLGHCVEIIADSPA